MADTQVAGHKFSRSATHLHTPQQQQQQQRLLLLCLLEDLKHIVVVPTIMKHEDLENSTPSLTTGALLPWPTAHVLLLALPIAPNL
jgi:hypothetical protein